MSRCEGIKKYLRAAPDDFLEEYRRLPPDANPLDPQFADPQMLLAGAHINNNNNNNNNRFHNHQRRRGDGVIVHQQQQRGDFGNDFMMDEEDGDMAEILRNIEQSEIDMLMAQQQHGLNSNEMEGRPVGGAIRQRQNQSLVERLMGLPISIRTFLLDIMCKRCKQLPRVIDEDSAEQDEQDEYMISFIDEESVLAEIMRLRDTAAANGDDIDLSGANIEELVFELLHCDPAEFLDSIHHRAAGSGAADGLALDLNQPLMQLFLRSLLPWNRIDTSESSSSAKAGATDRK